MMTRLLGRLTKCDLDVIWAAEGYWGRGEWRAADQESLLKELAKARDEYDFRMWPQTAKWAIEDVLKSRKG